MTKKNIVVTGGTGFIGRNFVAEAVKKDYEVICIVRRSVTEFRSASVTYYEYSDYESIRRLFSENSIDFVIHAASKFVVDHKDQDISELIQSNIEFGTWVAEAMTKYGCHKLLTIGSVWQNHLDEDYHPTNLYAATKQAFWDVLRYFVEARALDVLEIKLADTFGLGDDRPKVFNLLRTHSMSGQPIGMTLSEQEMSLLHINEAVTGLFHACDFLESLVGQASYGVYNPEILKLREIVALFQKHGKKHFSVQYGEREYRERESMKFARSVPLLPGWRPAKSLEVHVRNFVNS